MNNTIKENLIYYGEVTDVILSDNNPEYQTYIKCRLLSSESAITARAINKQIKHIPVKGEIVLLLYAPSAAFSKNDGYYEFYYLFPINLHENLNHNSLFNATNVYKDIYDKKKLDEEFGADYEEKPTNDLQIYEGDYLIQGRFGNSIRLSKTNIKNNLNHPSCWVKDSNDYDPIIIISNNREVTDINKNKQTTEDINKDGSSIYVSYKQKINLESGSDKFDSFDDKPKGFFDYTENQILLNSDRIVINAKNDGVFLNAKTTVHLSSDDTVNIDAKNKTVIDSKNIYVGNKDAEEPFLFGNKTEEWLKELLDLIKDLYTSLAAHTHGTGVGPSTNPLPPELIKYSTTFPTSIEKIKAKIIELKSKVNFVT